MDSSSQTQSHVVARVPDDQRLVLFDGECNLCHGAVQFIIRRDPSAKFRFAALASKVAKEALQRAGASGALPDSILLVHEGKVRAKSAASLAIARGLRMPWPLLSIFWLIPYPLRDLVYGIIAKNRIRWFGRREECWVPTPELRARFADANERA